MKKYHIIPNSDEYDNIDAENREDALVKFATNMDMDMSAYFDAIEHEPEEGLHEYGTPENKFEKRMNCAASVILDDKSSPYYLEDADIQ